MALLSSASREIIRQIVELYKGLYLSCQLGSSIESNRYQNILPPKPNTKPIIQPTAKMPSYYHTPSNFSSNMDVYGFDPSCGHTPQTCNCPFIDSSRTQHQTHTRHYDDHGVEHPSCSAAHHFDTHGLTRSTTTRSTARSTQNQPDRYHNSRTRGSVSDHADTRLTDASRSSRQNNLATYGGTEATQRTQLATYRDATRSSQRTQPTRNHAQSGGVDRRTPVGASARSSRPASPTSYTNFCRFGPSQSQTMSRSYSTRNTSSRPHEEPEIGITYDVFGCPRYYYTGR